MKSGSKLEYIKDLFLLAVFSVAFFFHTIIVGIWLAVANWRKK